MLGVYQIKFLILIQLNFSSLIRRFNCYSILSALFIVLLTLPSEVNSKNNNKNSLIAIVIDDLGHSSKALASVMELKLPLTLAFLPYPKNASVLAELALSAGYEILVHVPMEPTDPNIDPGPFSITSKHNASEIKALLQKHIDNIHGAVGINNHMGSLLSRNKLSMASVMKVLLKNSLFYLDSMTINESKGWETAKSYNVPFAKRDIFLDNSTLAKDIKQQLYALQELALLNGTAVAIGHPNPMTYKMIEEWLPQAKSHGIKVVPLSQIVELKCNCNLNLGFSKNKAQKVKIYP